MMMIITSRSIQGNSIESVIPFEYTTLYFAFGLAVFVRLDVEALHRTSSNIILIGPRDVYADHKIVWLNDN